MCVNIFVLTAFREAIQWLEERENFEQVKEWFDSTSRCTDFTLPLFSISHPPVTSLSYFTCYLTSVLYLTSSCYLSSYFTCTSLAYFTCYLSFLFYLLLLFPILPVSSLSCFTGYLSCQFYVTSLSSVREFVLVVTSLNQ